MTDWTDQKLRRISQARQGRRSQARPVGDFLARYVNQKVVQQQGRLARLQEAWIQLLPVELSEHCRPRSLRAGRLYVEADDASTIFELDQMLKEGLLEQLRESCPRIAISQVKLVRG